jgi:hypothetical protein
VWSPVRAVIAGWYAIGAPAKLTGAGASDILNNSK